MPNRLTGDPARPDRPSTDRSERWTLIGLSLTAIALCVAQAAGRIIPETKLEVALDPVTFLGRALRLWDPIASFGRLQDQAVGYLFPMGPFYALGRGIGLPAWLVQRLWIAALLIVGLWGAHRVARALGVATRSGRVLAGVVYTLAPATMATVAFQSAGQVPYSLLPWVLVPLLEADRSSSPRRAAAASGLAVAAMGAVNGAAVVAVLPLPLLWFLTRPAGARRRSLALWWVGSLALATFWWVLPLLLYVRHGLHFTQFTETALITTSSESTGEVLRGTGNWLAYLVPEGNHWLPGAWALTSARLAIVGSSLVAALGLVGLARHDAPERRWLGLGAVLGVVAVGAGYSGALGGTFAGPVRNLLDGTLTPLRNVHKFSPVLRLPLAVGFGHAVAVAQRAVGRWAGGRRAAGRRAEPSVRRDVRHAFAGRAMACAAAGLTVLAIAPAVPGHIPAEGSFPAVPSYWRDGIRWIDRHSHGGRTLLVPGAAFGEYTWGRPLDEPLSAFGSQPWSVRDLIPLGGEGSTRIMDAIERDLQGGRLPDGFSDMLGRAGVRYVLARNDLDRDRTGRPAPVEVRRLLAGAAGLRRVAQFGPPVDRGDRVDRLAPRTGPGAAERIQALEVWEVRRPVDRIAAYPVAGSLSVSGGPEAVLPLAASGLLGRGGEARGTVLTADRPRPDNGQDDPLAAATPVATDTARRRDTDFGSIRDNQSYTLTADERAPDTNAEPVDRLPWPAANHLAAAVSDAARITASGYDGGDFRLPETQPAAAFDGNPATAWQPEEVDPTGQWIQVDFARARTVHQLSLRVRTTRGPRVNVVRITTDRGTREVGVAQALSTRVALPPGRTRRVRVTITNVKSGRSGFGPANIAEIALDRIAIRRPIRSADDQVGRDGGRSRAAGAAVFERLEADPYDRSRSDEDGRLDRRFRAISPEGVTVSGVARPVPGDALDRLVGIASGPAARERDGRGSGVQVAASSTWRRLPAFAARSALDGSTATPWVPDIEDRAPSLSLHWSAIRSVDRMLLTPVASPFNRITHVVISSPAGSRSLRVGRHLTHGAVSLRFAPLRTDRVTISFPGTPHGGAADARTIGVAELRLPALGGMTVGPVDRGRHVAMPCGSGPPLSVDGRRVATRADATIGALVDLAPVRFEACSPVRLASGWHAVEGGPGVALEVDTVRLMPASGLPAVGRRRALRVRRWNAESRRIDIAPGGSALLALTENATSGWQASLDGRRLTPIRVDGWRQAFVVPAGRGGQVTMRYGPGRTQRLGLIVGLLFVVGLVGLALLPGPSRSSRGSAETEGAGLWRDRPLPGGLVYLVAAGAGLLLGGPLVIVVVVLAFLPRRSELLPAIAGLAAVAAGVVTFLAPGQGIGSHAGAFSPVTQALAVLAVLALAVSLLPEEWGRRHPVPSSTSASGSATTPG